MQWPMQYKLLEIEQTTWKRELVRSKMEILKLYKQKRRENQSKKKKKTYENYPLIRKGNIRILGIPEGKEREKGTEYIYRNDNRKCPKPEVETRYTSPWS